MDDLVAFVRARLDEDWKLANEAGDGGYDTWHFNPKLTWESTEGPREAVVRFSGSAMTYIAAVDPVHGKYGTWNARHIARHDPTRVLREVDAKRQMIETFTRRYDASRRGTGGRAEATHWVVLHDMLRLLALPYAEHPDYRPEWAPGA